MTDYHTHYYCAICFHSLFVRNRLIHAPFIVTTAICYRQNFEGKKIEKNMRLELCGTVKQEVEEAASFDKVTSNYNLQNKSNYTGNSF